jgi:hypothetical protein
MFVYVCSCIVGQDLAVWCVGPLEVHATRRGNPNVMMFMSPDMHAKGFAGVGAWLLRSRRAPTATAANICFLGMYRLSGSEPEMYGAASSAFSEWSSVTEMAVALKSERSMLADKISQGFGVVVVAGAMASRSRNPGFVDADGRSLQ